MSRDGEWRGNAQIGNAQIENAQIENEQVDNAQVENAPVENEQPHHLSEIDLGEIDRITDPITRSRAVAARSMKLLRASVPDTFLGRGRYEPFPAPGRRDDAHPATVDRSQDPSQDKSEG